jgi:hypothetical protein
MSALSAAVGTGIVGGLLLQEAEDRRLFEAARDLVFLLGDAPLESERIRAIVLHEHEETKHAGIQFMVSELDGSIIAGEGNIERLPPDVCSARGEDRLRICSVASPAGVLVTPRPFTPHRRFHFLLPPSSPWHFRAW